MSELAKVKEMVDRPLNELLTRDMVDIYVGPESTHWILHEKLLCTRSAFFRKTFYTSHRSSRSSSSSSGRTPSGPQPSTDSSSPATKSIGLPDDDDQAFTSFVAWLYSNTVPPPRRESDLTPLFDLYLMAERWGIPSLLHGALEEVRAWYRETESYPGLRRVQYVYANTEDGSAMREFLLGAVARMLVLGEGTKDGEKGMPLHWEKALRKNGMLATDVILRVQKWGWDRDHVPDVRLGEDDAKNEGGSQNEDETLVNGVNGTHGDKEGDIKKEAQEARRFNMATLDKELPNGLVNGHRE